MDGTIHEEHFGFRPRHSTTLQVVQVLISLDDAVNNNQATGTVLLDVSKVFNKVCHEGVLYKLALLLIPPTIVHLL